jgi:hypothetical protein
MVAELKCRECGKPAHAETSWVLDRKLGAHRGPSVSPKAEAFTCAQCLMIAARIPVPES